MFGSITVNGEFYGLIVFLLFVLLVVHGLASDVIKFFKKESYFFVHYVVQNHDGSNFYNSSYLQFKATRFFSLGVAAETIKKAHKGASVLVIDYKEVPKGEYEFNTTK